ncbi:ABC transporter permease [Marinoscillum sp. 108]|uniref:ABC transporter permease n=1 Tax=Marinoscillum sp. 108 TaxID=2653151 RepID=UPI0012F3944C|nr:ABC transporter permease [Marinoscillum sp. 108]VXD15864.1 conserved membrane hypothetical protein [Marinoscillum sp. 108]
MEDLNIQPPRGANRLLAFFCKTEYLEDIQGDLEEEYILKHQKGPLKALLWYYWQVIRLFRPGLTKSSKINHLIPTNGSMFRNHLIVAIRNLWKYKSGTAINIIGLSTGICAFILIALFIQDELSYDQHHVHADNTYRLTVKNIDKNGELSRHWAFASAGHAQRLKADYPEITHATRFYAWAFPDIQIGDKVFPSEQVVFADKDVFEVFTFPFILGNAESAFREIKSIVLTEQSAIRLFGNDWRNDDILGKTIQITRDATKASFVVSGVMEDMPENQHFHFEYLAPIEFLEPVFGEGMNNVTGNYNWLTYLRLQEGTDPRRIEQYKDDFFDKYVGLFENGIPAKKAYDFELQPLLSIHLNSHLEGEIESNGSLQQVYIFGTVGILLLVVACINYMNLATSHFSRRTKEVGVRKAIGAHKSSLIQQFLTESLMVNLLSFPVAIMLTWLALPYLNDFMEKQLTFNMLENRELLLGLILLLVMVAIISGSYPALFLSRINLIQALKGEAAINSNKWNFRSWLITFQYAVTIGLLFTLAVIEGQMKFIQNSDPGYRKDQILHLSMSRNIRNLDVFKNELLSHPAIHKATYASRVPTGRLADNWNSAFFNDQTAVETTFRLPFILADEDFLETFEIELVAGKNFTAAMEMSTDSVGYYLVNRAAAKALGFDDPEDIVGRKLSYGNYDDHTYKAGRILGVTEDFHFESLHSEITPMVILKGDWNMRTICMQISPGDVQSALAHVEETWTKFDPINSPEYQFMDDLFDQQYQAEERLSTMIKVFTVIAVLIGCLGLIGMVGFIIDTRYKEIGIRKVLGASVFSIISMIGQRFLILIGIGCLVALPTSYFFISGWLDGFVYHINIGLLLVILPAVATLVLTLATISYQTLKASLINPVECLKDE